jgi:hypothetical protein
MLHQYTKNRFTGRGRGIQQKQRRDYACSKMAKYRLHKISYRLCQSLLVGEGQDEICSFVETKKLLDANSTLLKKDDILSLPLYKIRLFQNTLQ